METSTLGIRKDRGFGAAVPRPARSSAYASPAVSPRPAQGWLPARAGSPLAGQDSHLLDDTQSFMKASPPPIPFDPQGLVALGFDIRQYRVGKHPSGKGPRGGKRLGDNTLIKPAKANIQEHLAELGRIIRHAKALSQGQRIRQLNPVIRGWGNYERTGVSQAVYDRLDHLPWA